jgi:signal transduction histidine kinase
VYQDFPPAEPIELNIPKNNLEVDKLIQTSNDILTGDSDLEEILPLILEYIGEYFDLDRIIIYRLGGEDLQVEAQWLAHQGILSPATDLLIQESNKFILPDDILELGLERDLSSLEIGTIQIDLPIHFGKQLFGLLRLERINDKDLFSPQDKYTLEKMASQIAIALRQEMRLRKVLKLNADPREMLAHVSHELKTPLTAIIGFAKMLKKQLYGQLNTKQMQYVTAIYNSGEYLLALINDLLELTKIESKKEELYLENILIKKLCKEALELVQEKADERGLELIFLMESQQEYFRADRTRVMQILLNLLSNAIKFTEKGTITLQVTTTQEGTDFSVIDTGIGIEEEYQQKIFEPFSQILTPLHRKCQGIGLGLALSRKLARLHGGDIRVKSAEGKGSCFTLHLPA